MADLAEKINVNPGTGHRTVPPWCEMGYDSPVPDESTFQILGEESAGKGHDRVRRIGEDKNRCGSSTSIWTKKNFRKMKI